MLTRNISLPVELDNAVQGYLESGLYGNYSEVIRSAIRIMLEVREQKHVRLEMIRQDLQKSLAQVRRGEVTPLNLAEIKKEVDDELAAEELRRENERNDRQWKAGRQNYRHMPK